ncbi:MAG: carboxypeptidase-like regulatory domain-containing protein [Bryobacteraceae bacterium]
MVTDPTQAVVPGARITITNTGANQNRTTETDVTGRYSFRSARQSALTHGGRFGVFHLICLK